MQLLEQLNHWGVPLTCKHCGKDQVREPGWVLYHDRRGKPPFTLCCVACYTKALDQLYVEGGQDALAGVIAISRD